VNVSEGGALSSFQMAILLYKLATGGGKGENWQVGKRSEMSLGWKGRCQQCNMKSSTEVWRRHQPQFQILGGDASDLALVQNFWSYDGIFVLGC
jgi:hypothetical protein